MSQMDGDVACMGDTKCKENFSKLRHKRRGQSKVQIQMRGHYQNGPCEG